MRVIETISELKDQIRLEKADGRSIGLVPTMGFLHEGHLTLAKKAREENDVVVMTIFVNPLQFGPNEDFDLYPRDLERDKELALQAGVDILFTPATEDMYPDQPVVSMKVLERTDALCGQKREGHFDGVVTVVTKLFHLSEADKAYFGLKDAQQVAVLEGLVKTFNFPVELIGVDTVREEDGLAKSSRNVYLDEQERKAAPAIYQALKAGKEMAMQGEMQPDQITAYVSEYLSKHTGAVVDYAELLSYPDLKPLEETKGQVILAAAVKFSKARLIDNLIFTL
ncbi:pantoate--beta-alanine ligase [Bacillus ectoiniformans]|uniref:pantoate--beta-alanine ligase n=1 Tax=Bacillus ectoiniformans TaxID=1494429 RepID=UPI00195653CE|nr:pantoate--beta-alanine ligase [Bacillus ectoiniformans]MBM7647967.1 pantoate--beta-alanine ligase [Bacillus ectoiniformans]